MTSLNFKFKDSAIAPDLTISSNIEFKPGEVLGIIGRNGIGKTSLLRSLSLRKPDNLPGNITYDGASLVFQSSNLFPWLTVRKNIELAAGTRENSRILLEQVSEVLGFFNISSDTDRWPKGLSGGEAKIIAIVRAYLSSSSSLLLLDEPYSSLDISNGTTLTKFFKDKMFPKHKYIGIVSHDPSVLQEFCDRVLILKSESIPNDPLASQRLVTHELEVDRTENLEEFTHTIVQALN